MPAWIVIYRRHLTQSGLRDGHCQAVPKSPSLRTLCLCVKLSDPFLPTFPLSPIFRIFFQVPYPATPLFATLAKTAGVCTNNSHSGTHQSRLQSAHMSDCLYPLSPIRLACLRVKLSDSVNGACYACPEHLRDTPGVLIPILSLDLHLLTFNFQPSLRHCLVTSLLPLPIGNSIGSAGGASAISSSCGYCRRSGSGTFTFEPFRMLMSCKALTADFP